MKFKRNLVFAFFLLAGIIVGAMIASAAEGMPYLEWLAYGKTIGISAQNPIVLDLSMVKLAFGCEIGVNVAQIAAITGALLIYRDVGAKL